MKIEIRLEIGIPMCNFVAEKMEAIGCLASELHTEMHGDAERNFSRKRNVFTLLWQTLMSPYTAVLRNFTCVLVKKQLGSQQRQLL